MKKFLAIAAIVLVLAAIVFTPYLLDLNARRRAEAQLLAQPIYQVVKKHESGLYQRLLDKYLDSLDGESTAAGFTNFANGALSEAATKRLAHASDDSVNALIHDMLANARQLAKQPGDACFRFLFPQVAGPPDVARLVDAAAQAHTLQLLAEVMRTSYETPSELPEAAAVQDKIADVVNGIYQQYGADAQMVAHTEDPRIDRAKVCTMTIALYERVMAWPPADSSAIIRAMTQVSEASGTG